MFTIFRIFGAFFRLGPKMASFVAICLFVIAAMLMVNSAKLVREGEAAIAAGPPDVVSLGIFDREKHITELGELHIMAQLDLNNVSEYIEEKKRSIKTWTLFPLLDISSDSPMPLGILEFDTSEGIKEKLKEMIVGQGSFGPIVQINGRMTYAGRYKSHIEKSFVDEYGFYSPDTVYIRSFYGERSKHLGGGSLESFFAQILGFFGLLFAASAAFQFYKQRPNKTIGSSDVDAEQEPETVVRRKK